MQPESISSKNSCDQGLPCFQLNIVFDALVLSRVRYAVPVWSGFMSVELKGQVNSFLKRAFKCGFYPRGASNARVIAMTVCPCVCLSHAGIVSKRLNVGSRKEHHVIAHGI